MSTKVKKGYKFRKQKGGTDEGTNEDMSCPISLENIKDLDENLQLKVCPDPTIYSLEHIGQWIFDNGNNVWPHNRQKISPCDLKRIYDRYMKLTPKPTPIYTLNSTSQLISSRNTPAPLQVTPAPLPIPRPIHRYTPFIHTYTPSTFNTLNIEEAPKVKFVIKKMLDILNTTRPEIEIYSYPNTFKLYNLTCDNIKHLSVEKVDGDLTRFIMIGAIKADCTINNTTRLTNNRYLMHIMATINLNNLTGLNIEQEFTKSIETRHSANFSDQFRRPEVILLDNSDITTNLIDSINQISMDSILLGGKKLKATKMYNKKKYIVRTGTKGGQYILVKDKKIYI